MRVFSRSWMPRISSKEVLNLQYPARLNLLTNRRLALTSLWSVCSIQWNVGHVMNSVSAFLTLRPNKIWYGQRANYRATSTSPSQGDPDKICRPSRVVPSSQSGCFYTFPILLQHTRVKDRIPITH